MAEHEMDLTTPPNTSGDYVRTNADRRLRNRMAWRIAAVYLIALGSIVAAGYLGAHA